MSSFYADNQKVEVVEVKIKNPKKNAEKWKSLRLKPKLFHL